MRLSAASSRPRGRAWWQRGRMMVAVPVAVVLVAAALGWWFYDRINFVRATDARIHASMITLSAPVSGRITELNLVAGDRIEEGQLLVRLDDREARAKLDATRARASALEAELEVLEERIALERERVVAQRQRAESRLTAAEASREVQATQRVRARRELDRVAPMARKGLASDQARDDAELAAAAAEERLKQAEAERAEAEAALAEARVAAREPEVLRRQRAVVSARLAEARAEAALREVNLADRVIRSPIDGVVDKIFVEAGEYVSESRYLLMIHEPGAVWVEARIKETRLAPIEVGQPVTVSVDAYPDNVYRGRVQRVVRAATSQFALLPDPNPSGNFTKITQRLPVRIALDEPDEKLAPGMMVEVAIHVGG